MKKHVLCVLSLMLLILLFACSPAFFAPEPTSAPVPTPTPAPSTPPPTPSPEPTPTPFDAETPDSAGSGELIFDIYEYKALADLNRDGAPEELEFVRGKSASTLLIGETEYTVDQKGLAQRFAVTDIDPADGTMELVFTAQYRSDLGDTEFEYSYLYWWDGAELKRMGALMDMVFDGAWRGGFRAKDHFDAEGKVFYLRRTQELTDLWYMGRFAPDGEDRKLKEESYTVKPLYNPEPLTVKAGAACMLLTKITSDYFGASHSGMWDLASYPHAEGRAIGVDADVFTVIAQPGEVLSIERVYGKHWVKLKTEDGYQGWIKVADHKTQGYDDVMYWEVFDQFDGIVVAG